MNSGATRLPRFPFETEFLCSLQRQNTFVGSRCLLAYQKEILCKGELSVVSPFTGERTSSGSSLYLEAGAIAYSFCGPPPFWVVSSALRLGYPLTHALIPTSAGVATVPEVKEGVAEKQFTSVQETIFSRAGQASESDCPAIVIGHQNFAHHLWNELGGLHEWLKLDESNKAKFKIFPQYEPLGNLEDLFPNLDPTSVLREKPSALSSYRGMLTRVGSTQIPAGLRRNIAGFLSKSDEVPPPIKAQVAGASPVFWINVRPQSIDRSCKNEVEFLHALGKVLLEKFPQSVLVFDGFSLPIDFERSKRYDTLKSKMLERERQCEHEISEISSLIAAGCEADSGRILSVSGWRLDHALSLAAETDFYISHAGTLQHKVGWVHNKPGFIHSCRAIIHPSVRSWYADQVEGGVLPFVIDTANVRDIPVEATRKIPLRNHSYVIEDVPAVVDRIVELVLSQTS